MIFEGNSQKRRNVSEEQQSKLKEDLFAQFKGA